MSSAVERLAAQLSQLSDDEWTRVTQRWIGGQDWNGVFGPAWDEFSERLTDSTARRLRGSDEPSPGP